MLGDVPDAQDGHTTKKKGPKAPEFDPNDEVPVRRRDALDQG